MVKNDAFFERTEKKYLITANKKNALLEAAAAALQPDRYFKSTICNLYFDTPDYRIIRQSEEKPLYKEKLRLRSYGVPSEESPVFLEIKKKYKGTVYKRREKMTLRQAQAYWAGSPPEKGTQILREIDHFRRFYPELFPAAYISYNREAFTGTEDENLRLTFDENLFFRQSDLFLESGIYGNPILEEGAIILEIKSLGAMPLWLAAELSRLNIFPSSFSKYGKAYQTYIASGISEFKAQKPPVRIPA